MAGKVMFCPLERGIPDLHRGYRTPDPSPSPPVVPHAEALGQLELRVVEGDEKPWNHHDSEGRQESEDTATPLYGSSRSSRSRFSSRSRLSSSSVDVSRTPSPSRSRTATNFRTGQETETATQQEREPRAEPQSMVMNSELLMQQEAAAQAAQALHMQPPTHQQVIGSFPQQLLMPSQCYLAAPEFEGFLVMPPPLPEQESYGWERGTSPASGGGGSVADRQDNATAASIGSIGHPYTCADACKYVWKRRGCKDGANCVRCHLCLWNESAARHRQRHGS